MKDLFKELILEKGKELAAMGAVLLLVALGAAAIYLYTQGGTPFVPEEVGTARAQVAKDLLKSIRAAEDSSSKLKELLTLESEGNTSEVLQKAPIYKVDLSKIEEPLLDMPQEIQTVADHIPEVRPRSAGKALSGAMNAAAQASMELLRLRQDSVSLYDGLEARARGEEFKEYKTIADRIKRQGDLINSLYDEFKAKIDTFKTLTSPKPNEQPS